jgi:hypothetical protein
MTGFKQIARKVVDDAVNAGKFDGIPDRRLEELEMQLALELLEAADAFVDYVAKGAATGFDVVREDLETLANVAAASLAQEARRAA